MQESPVAMQYSKETVIGLSKARNRGARVAQGRILAYLDDDAVAERNWLNAICQAYETHPDLWVAGGPIKLRWLGERPKWLTRDMETLLTALDLDNDGNLLYLDEEFPFGANFTCRRDCWEKVGGFREAFTLYDDERYFCHRVRELEGNVAYVPGAMVWHKVSVHRLRRRYFLRRNYLQGEANFVFRCLTTHKPINLHYVLYVAKNVVREMVASAIRNPTRCLTMDSMLKFAYDLGVLKGAFSVWRHGAA